MSDSSPSERSSPGETGSPIEQLEGRLMLHSVARRSDEIADERAVVEEIQGSLGVDEKSLLLDVSALSAERDELAQELAQARDRLASLDAAIAAERLAEAAKAHALDAARSKLERDRALAGRLEQEILGYRKQMASAQERLGDLVKTVLRIQHKLWRVANEAV